MEKYFKIRIMEMYQVEITTDMDVVNIIVNASDENEAISIALTMFEQGEIDTEGSVVMNIAAFPAC
ncbi:hypothetical protein [Segatella copri]|jgi:hypothetical protein|uniref:hypothetical protein n=1 Tax=Segatella copri TaxID=165179 RepID=UPI00261FBA94